MRGKETKRAQGRQHRHQGEGQGRQGATDQRGDLAGDTMIIAGKATVMMMQATEKQLQDQQQGQHQYNPPVLTQLPRYAQ